MTQETEFDMIRNLYANASRLSVEGKLTLMLNIADSMKLKDIEEPNCRQWIEHCHKINIAIKRAIGVK